jgi:hypothetical protein
MTSSSSIRGAVRVNIVSAVYLRAAVGSAEKLLGGWRRNEWIWRGGVNVTRPAAFRFLSTPGSGIEGCRGRELITRCLMTRPACPPSNKVLT